MKTALINFLKAMLVSALGALVVVAWYYLRDPDRFPISRVEIHGISNRIDKPELQQAISPELNRGFFAVRVTRLQRAINEIPWVEAVSIRRVWPESLVINIVEREPIARWGENGLLTAYGELFYPSLKTIPADLPMLQGPPGKSKQVLNNYLKMQEELDALGVKAKRLTLHQRGSWVLELDSGLLLELGRDDIFARLQRFVQAYPDVSRLTGRIASYVDLRYPNGMAVRWN